ncbi:MAG: SUF system Fe-S cluster assembly protein [Pseudomonadota bacterium]
MTEVNALGERIVGTLKTVYDPEIPVDIYELGLIYKIDIEDDNSVRVEMTLTSPHCPVAETLPMEVEQKVGGVDGVSACRVDITWDPPWNPQLMSEEAQLELGMVY